MHCEEFAPIVKGPIIAVAWLSLLAGVAAVYLVINRVSGLFRSGKNA